MAMVLTDYFVGSRFFAAEAASAPKSDKLTLNLATPYQVNFSCGAFLTFLLNE